MAATDDIQLLSLVENPIENEFHAERIEQVPSTQPRRSNFWKGLFQRRRGGENEEEDLEGSALLDYTPDLKFDSRREDDEELDDYRDGEGDSSHRARLLASDDSEDEDDDADSNSNVWNGRNNGSMSSSHDLTKMHSSAPVLSYSPEAKGTGNDESGSDDDDDDDDDDDGDDDDDDEDEDESGDEENEEGNGSLHEPIRYQPPPLSSPIQPLRKFLQRSQSVNSQSYYSDNRPGDEDDGLTVDTSNRKNIHGRIQGFGNELPSTPNQGPDSQPASVARNLRQRLLDLTSAYRMRKMAIGTEETLQRKTWVERFDDVVDRVLPPDPELDGYIDAFKIAGKAIVVLPHEEPSDPEDDHASPTSRKKSAQSPLSEPPVPHVPHISRGRGVISHRRKALGNIDDASYIVYLETELQNKELELNSWKRRLKELEAEVQRLKGLRDEDDDESQGSSSDSSNNDEKDPGESEIEWQTGVAEEGLLIEVESSPQEARVHQEEVITQKALPTPAEPATFVMSHAPDGPDGDEENKQEPLEKDEAKNDNGYDDDDFFPVLSSKNRESATNWADVKPSTTVAAQKSPVQVGPSQSSDKNDNDDENEDEGEQSEEGEDDDEEDEEEGEEEGDDDDVGDEGEEASEKTEDDLLPPEEGMLITLDDPPTAMPTPTADTGVAIVSDDDEGSDNHATKIGDLLVLDEVTTKDQEIDDIPTKVQSDVTLIDFES